MVGKEGKKFFFGKWGKTLLMKFANENGMKLALLRWIMGWAWYAKLKSNCNSYELSDCWHGLVVVVRFSVSNIEFC